LGETRVIGVDLGGTHVRGVVADEQGRFLDRCEVRTLAAEGLEAVLGRITSVVRELCAREPRVSAIGIGAPGPIDSRAGVVSTPPNLPGWVDVPLGRILQEAVGLPTFLGNDANLAALGEFEYGAGRDVRHLIYITVSTGVGGGIVVDGRLLEGQRGAAGEVGHMVVEPGGPLCSCGGYGHLEALVSGTAIGRQAREALQAGRSSLATELARGNPTGVTARVITEAGKQGDALAVELLTRAGRRLGLAVINLVHLFNPQMVAIGGGVSVAGELLLGPMREVVLDGVMPVFKEDLQLVPASLGRDVGLFGAVALALRGASTPDAP
jgi:glucokinase